MGGWVGGWVGRGWVGRGYVGSTGATEFELPFLLLLQFLHIFDFIDEIKSNQAERKNHKFSAQK